MVLHPIGQVSLKNSGLTIAQLRSADFFPLYDFASTLPSYTFAVCMIFRPSCDRLAIIVARSPKAVDAIKNSGLVSEGPSSSGA